MACLQVFEIDLSIDDFRHYVTKFPVPCIFPGHREMIQYHSQLLHRRKVEHGRYLFQEI